MVLEVLSLCDLARGRGREPRDHAGSEEQEDLPGQGMSDNGNRGKDSHGC